MYLHLCTRSEPGKLATWHNSPRACARDLVPFAENKCGPSSLSDNHFLFLSFSSTWVNLRLHTENQLCNTPGSGLTVCVGGGGVVGGG